MLKAYDYILLDETWCKEESQYELDGYEAFCSHRKRIDARAWRMSGGVIFYVKSCLARGVKCIDNDTSDKIWLMLDKSFFGVKNDILLCLTYIPPENSSGSKNNDQDM